MENNNQSQNQYYNPHHHHHLKHHLNHHSSQSIHYRPITSSNQHQSSVCDCLNAMIYCDPKIINKSASTMRSQRCLSINTFTTNALYNNNNNNPHQTGKNYGVQISTPFKDKFKSKYKSYHPEQLLLNNFNDYLNEQNHQSNGTGAICCFQEKLTSGRLSSSSSSTSSMKVDNICCYQSCCYQSCCYQLIKKIDNNTDHVDHYLTTASSSSPSSSSSSSAQSTTETNRIASNQSNGNEMIIEPYSNSSSEKSSKIKCLTDLKSGK